MDSHSFSLFHPFNQLRNTHKPNVDDVPSFEDAFRLEDLRRFYQQPQQTQNYTNLYAKDDYMREELSSTDDQETQASPMLIRYNQKFNHINESRLAINLSHQFGSDDTEMMTETPFNNFQFSRIPQETPITHMIPQQPINRVSDVKKIVEMKGNLNMTMSFGNFKVNSGFHEEQNNLRTPSKPKLSIMDDNYAFEKVLKSKKIFKIQKDLKPKSPVKQKIIKQQNINAGASHQTIKLPITALRVCRGDFSSHPEGEQMKPENAPFMNFLNAMQEKGYTPQQIMTEIQKFMNQNAGEQAKI